MKRYNYKAKVKSTGKIVRGSIQADTEQTAGRLLVEQGYLPISVVENGTNLLFGKKVEKVKTADRIVFTRQLSTLINAGLPLASSLKTVAEQTQSRPMKAVIEEISAGVESGKTLYDSFAKRPDVFDGVYLALVKAGEASGSLDVSLARLADQEEKSAALMSKVRGALVYPAIILVVIIAVLAFMMVMVVPEVKGLYEDMGEELPSITQFLVNISDFFGNFWWLVLAILVGSVVGVMNYLKTKQGRRLWDNFKIHVIIFGPLMQKLAISRFARTAEMLLAVGVSMLDSITISIGATNNSVIGEELEKSLGMIKGGKTLSDSLKDRKYMLPLVPQMASIGEESGKIDEMLGKAAQVYENEVDTQVDNISTMIEPILMVVMAGLIGVVVAGTLLPIYSLVSQVG